MHLANSTASKIALRFKPGSIHLEPSLLTSMNLVMISFFFLMLEKNYMNQNVLPNNCKIFTVGLKGPLRPSLKVKLIFVFVLLADIAQRYRISKYPTLKLFRNGMMMKREYRGQRSVKALADYIRQQKSDPIQELHDLAEITTPDVSH